jgi:hypothetical protein
MRVHDRSIRPIPRQAADGYICLGIIEDDKKFYVIQMEPQEGVSVAPLVRVVEFKPMQRSRDLLDGDTNEIMPTDEREAVLKYAVEQEILSEKRVEIGVRKAAALSKSLRPPTFHHTYKCLMYMEKLAAWDHAGRKGKAPAQMVSTYDCWICTKLHRELCIGKLLDYEDDTGDKDKYVKDIETSPIK